MKPEPGNLETPGAEAVLSDESSTQAQRFTQAFALIREAIAQRIFPGATLAVLLHGRLLAWEGFGRFTYQADSPEVRRETVWDLASLTKPIATTSMAMLLVDRGLLALDAPVADYLHAFADPGPVRDHQPPSDNLPTRDKFQYVWRKRVTVAMLLAHCSGFPAHRKFYLETSGREAMQKAARRTPLETAPGTHAEYSDIGFIVLGELLERVAGESLESFCLREVFAPLNLNFTFSPQLSQRTSIPPTVYDQVYRHRIVQGEVNDENASAMGGVAGHAGLFGDALSVARFAECILRGGTLPDGAPLFQPETVALFTRRQDSPPGTSRALGWDTPSSPQQANSGLAGGPVPPSQSGTMFSGRSFGHLGYTGTSLWCDAGRQLSVTLLTNRTWPDARNQAIKQLRPRVHDAIVRALPE